MAALLAWQFATAFSHLLLEDTAVEKFLWGTHKTLGFVLILLVILRACWSLHNRGHRPASLSIAATLGHLAMYALVIIIPLIALVRQYGSGRAFSPLGIPLMPGFDEKVEWMMLPANLLHSWLGWLLLLLIIGHVAMVLIHRRRGGEGDVLVRMFGR
ncbi:Ni-hydr-CYTB domain-containing protein [Pseudomonas sp. E102]